ncbi:MAG: alginate lyase family protein [Armatimonadetes bacterium]|nr:alginate lyase family protein [Armatimonadota bacterium]
MRHLTALVMLMGGTVCAQPMALVLDDFEGQSSGWSAAAEVVEGGKDGGKAIRWQPEAKGDPQAINCSFAGRGIEMGEWDRLLFDYRFDGAGCDWWGIKVIDFPLGDGMQCTWQLAGAKSIRPGEWQTAEVDIHNPTWLWGDKPDQKGQYIAFRYEGKANPQPSVLIDNLRVVRDAFRVEDVTHLGTQREGDLTIARYEVRVANRQDRLVALQVETKGADQGLRVDAPAEATVAAGAAAVVPVALSAAASGEGALPPLSRASAQLVIRVKGATDMDKSLSLDLTVPLTDVPHPCLLLTRADVPKVLARIEASSECKAIYDGLKRGADDWLARTPEYPDRGSQWWHWYTCKACGARLTTKSPTEHVCPDCGAVYSGWPYDDVVLDRQHGALAGAIRDLGLMYVLTGDVAYAVKAREILLGYAERYLSYPLHDINGKPSKGGGHVGPQSLDESTWLIPVAQGFDCIQDTLSADDLQTVSEKMLLPAAQLIHDHQWGIHNICCWHDSAYGLVGLALGNEQLTFDSINGPKGFRAQIEQGVTDDGFWYESAWGYHFYTMSALQPLAVAARNVGIDLYTDRYKGMYDAPLAFMAPGGELAAFNDSGTSNALGSGSMYEIAYARWQDPRHLLPILQSGRKSLQTLLYGVDLGETAPFTLQSSVFPAAGYVVLRSGATGEGRVNEHIPQTYLALDYGPHGGGHGHPDKLGFVLYGQGKLLAEDPGCIAYGNPAHAGWFRQTLSHNTIVVNSKSQKPCTGMLQFTAFGDGLGLCSARADEAYDGVRIRRSMALLGDRVIDVVLCEAETESTFDLAYHNRGAMECALPFAVLAEAPAGDGCSWAKEWRSAPAPEAWQAVWKQDQGPTVTFAQGAADGAREVLTAIGMGNPTKIKVPFVVSRQIGTSALFCTALDISTGDPVADLTVRVLPVEGPADARERPVAVEVTGGGIRDILLINPAGGALRAGEFELEGQGAALRYRDGKLEQIVAVGDAKVRVAGQ